jgi:hypothetical protein
MTAMAGSAGTIAGVPASLGYLDSPERAMERGTVLLYHGFAGAKERVEYYSTALAQAGFLAVSLDAIGHGERRWPDFDAIFNDERWDKQFEATETDFLKLIDDTAAEVPSIIDDLLPRSCRRPRNATNTFRPVLSATFTPRLSRGTRSSRSESSTSSIQASGTF